MRTIPQHKVHVLSRQRARIPVSLAAKRAMQRVAFEAIGHDVQGRMGDTLVIDMQAPSGAAARAIVKALRDLQETRGTVF